MDIRFTLFCYKYYLLNYRMLFYFNVPLPHSTYKFKLLNNNKSEIVYVVNYYNPEPSVLNVLERINLVLHTLSYCILITNIITKKFIDVSENKKF